MPVLSRHAVALTGKGNARDLVAVAGRVPEPLAGMVGGRGAWVNSETVIYNREVIPDREYVIETLHLPTGLVVEVDPHGANHIVAGGGQWAIHSTAHGYRDSRGRGMGKPWFPVAVDDLTGTVLLKLNYHGDGIALLGPNDTEPRPIFGGVFLEASFFGGVVCGRLSATVLRLIRANGETEDITVPASLGAQQVAGFVVLWIEGRGLYLVRVTQPSRGLLISADGRDYAPAIGLLDSGLVRVATAAGEAEWPWELREYDINPVIGSVTRRWLAESSAERYRADGWVDLTAPVAEGPPRVQEFAPITWPFRLQVFGGPGFKMNLGPAHDDMLAPPSGSFLTLARDNFDQAVAYAREHRVPLYAYVDDVSYPPTWVPSVDGIEVIPVIQAYPYRDRAGVLRPLEETVKLIRATVKAMREARPGRRLGMCLAYYRQIDGAGVYNWPLQHVLDLQKAAVDIAREFQVSDALAFHQNRGNGADGVVSHPALVQSMARLQAAAAGAPSPVLSPLPPSPPAEPNPVTDPAPPPVVAPPVEEVPVSPIPASRSELRPDDVLYPGQYLETADGRTQFWLQLDHNIVVYLDGDDVWAAGTITLEPYALVMQRDGNLVAHDDTGAPVWATGTDGHPGARLVLRYGTAVIVSVDGEVLWQAPQVVAPAPPGSPIGKPTGARKPNIAKALRGIFSELLAVLKPIRRPKPQAPGPHVPPPPPAVPSEPEPPPVVPPAPARPPRPTSLRGQFMLYTRNPWFGDPGLPKAMPDRFFMAELDLVWDVMPEEAERILSEYTALGFNHVTVGSPLDKGYHGHYPDVNWLDRPERYAAFLNWLLDHGVVFTLYCVPDMPPYFHDGDGSSRHADRAAIDRDFTPFYRRIAELVDVPRATPWWEQWASQDDMVWLFGWMRSLFPTADLRYHNALGHLSPCWSNQHEHPAWLAVVAAGCDGMDFQAHPESMWDKNEPRTALGQCLYDLWDMSRRFRGDNSPWGGAIINPRTGQPITLDFFEGCAHPMFWWPRDQAEHLPETWGREIRKVEGVRFLLDAKEPN